ncbi:hypothetical protein JOF56_000425 [Kibdelosporangium banguiense]|uniref:Uncharacterized protein n=1 Tax=Kibdelosporangium banguiense TaxID=1365924 RepID=A0ABS4T6J3_9PSEU|nr:hypothetical protein [Kibdelosporangium banguiense]MBP2320040.1 hypothetical protein [Kibdelosporangium banguiense]
MTDQARAIADAVLYEGYLLYPYRASAAKNKVRWQWGVLMPLAFASGGTGERFQAQSELLAEPADDAAVHVRLRFLQLQARVVQIAEGDGFRDVPSVMIGDTEFTTWDEAVEREVDAVVPVADLAAGATVPFTIDAGEDIEPLDGGRLVRKRFPLNGKIVLKAMPLPGPFGGTKITVKVVNTSDEVDDTRPEALRHAMIAAHLLLSITDGHFLSQLDPPEWASVATNECVNDGIWPVLVGGNDTVLCSPIILYDQPEIAPESAGNLFDGTEIDEILTLRTMTLTDEEKREARATDERAAEVIDRVDHLPAELVERLHGTLRYVKATTEPSTPWWDPGADESVSPETDSVTVAGVAVTKGSRVVLRPGRKRADAHDMFLAGRVAVVEAVLTDVDDGCHLAVTLKDDPGAELYAAHGRYRYFTPDEVEPL